MKRVYIIHGWGGSPDEPLHKWLASELRKKGFVVEVPAMPKPDEPKMETWIPFLSQLVGTPDSHSFFIGHSIGCQAIIRNLETLPEGVKIGGAGFNPGWYYISNQESWKEKVGAKIIVEHNKGHFTESDGVITLPSALDAVLGMK